jgi:diacylglycerol kinase family enzyme
MTQGVYASCDLVTRDAGVAVVLNGNARSVTGEVIGILTQVLPAGDLFVTHRAEDVPAFAHAVIDRGFSTVLVGGGDGTFVSVVSSVVQIARDRARPCPRFGVLRLGTGNAMGQSMGASVPTARGIASDILSIKGGVGSRRIRLVEVEGRLAPFAGLGLDAMILGDYVAVRRAFEGTPLARLASGGWGYAAAVVTRSIPRYVRGSAFGAHVVNLGEPALRLDSDGRPLGPAIPAGDVVLDGRVKMASVSTIPYYGMGFRMFPFTGERSDRMQLRMTTAGALELVAHLPKIWKGRYGSDTILDFWCTRVRLELDRPTALQIGGDAHGERTDVTFALSDEEIEVVDFMAPPA